MAIKIPQPKKCEICGAKLVHGNICGKCADMADKGKVYMTEWIPVEERLPKDNIPCICTVYNHDRYCDCVQVYDEILVYDEWAGTWISNANGEECCYDVIAWMPLPAPYEPY